MGGVPLAQAGTVFFWHLVKQKCLHLLRSTHDHAQDKPLYARTGIRINYGQAALPLFPTPAPGVAILFLSRSSLIKSHPARTGTANQYKAVVV